MSGSEWLAHGLAVGMSAGAKRAPPQGTGSFFREEGEDFVLAASLVGFAFLAFGVVMYYY